MWCMYWLRTKNIDSMALGKISNIAPVKMKKTLEGSAGFAETLNDIRIAKWLRL